ncbi:MAG: ribonuclease P protein component [Chloroflexi bacterium]|nr:ribonuclease P protein component [Chloroflexota bacterium]MBM4452691.1 ribonuclease P protein component [Chloroflexota bacterium]
MTRLRALRKRAQFAAVYKSGSGWGNRLVSVKALPNGLNANRYGFSVSKSLGNAVVRNRIRRLLREVIRQKPLKNGWDIILTPRASVVAANYQQLNESVGRLLMQAGLLNNLE